MIRRRRNTSTTFDLNIIQKIEQSVIRHAIVWCNSHQAARDAWQIKAQTAVVQGFGAPRYEKVAWRRLGYLEMAERIMPYADAQWCIQKWRGCQSRRDSWSKAAILKNCSSFTDQMLHAYWITKCLADKCQTDQTTRRSKCLVNKIPNKAKYTRLRLQ